MNTMEPIRNPQKIRELIKYVLYKGYKRDGILILFALNTLLRVSDMIDIKYEQLFDQNGEVREYFDIQINKSMRRSKENGKVIKVKTRRIRLPNDFCKELKKYADDYDMAPGDYIFYSTEEPTQHVHRKTIWRRLSRYAYAVGIEKLGTHGLRKTGAFQLWKKGVPIRVISQMLNHSSIAQTLQYISINQEMIDKAVESMNFSFSRILKNYE